jgi:hypothetical protein
MVTFNTISELNEHLCGHISDPCSFEEVTALADFYAHKLRDIIVRDASLILKQSSNRWP